jgi:hypothetical protein
MKVRNVKTIIRDPLHAVNAYSDIDFLTENSAKARLLCFSRIQSRVVAVLLTRRNTLRRHLHLLELIHSPLCRKCGAKDETLAHVLCRCQALSSLRHAYLGCFFLEWENIKNVSLEASWNFGKATRLLWIVIGHKGPVSKDLGESGLWGPEPTYNQSINQLKIVSFRKVLLPRILLCICTHLWCSNAVRWLGYGLDDRWCEFRQEKRFCGVKLSSSCGLEPSSWFWTEYDVSEAGSSSFFRRNVKKRLIWRIP